MNHAEWINFLQIETSDQMDDETLSISEATSVSRSMISISIEPSPETACSFRSAEPAHSFLIFCVSPRILCLALSRSRPFRSSFSYWVCVCRMWASTARRALRSGDWVVERPIRFEPLRKAWPSIASSESGGIKGNAFSNVSLAWDWCFSSRSLTVLARESVVAAADSSTVVWMCEGTHRPRTRLIEGFYKS